MDPHSIRARIKRYDRTDSGTKLTSVLTASDRMDPYSIRTRLECYNRTDSGTKLASVLDRICSLSDRQYAYARNVAADILGYNGRYSRYKRTSVLELRLNVVR